MTDPGTRSRAFLAQGGSPPLGKWELGKASAQALGPLPHGQHASHRNRKPQATLPLTAVPGDKGWAARVAQ
jgi:hypothetical protein